MNTEIHIRPINRTILGICPDGPMTEVKDLEEYLQKPRRVLGYEVNQVKTITIDGEVFKTEPKRVKTILFGTLIKVEEVTDQVLKEAMDAEGLKSAVQLRDGTFCSTSIESELEVRPL